MDIKLNFVNQSSDRGNSEVVIFQKNCATDFEELAVAWKVIRYCGLNSHHPFIFPMQMYVSAEDSYGNITQQRRAETGQVFHMRLGHSGHKLSLKGLCANREEIQVQNDLEQGAISANIFRDGKLLAQKTAIAPEQKAIFEFKPIICIGVASQIVEGEVMDSAIISNFNTELPLMGLASADIVMTGGGAGKKSTPFRFKLENIVHE